MSPPCGADLLRSYHRERQGEQMDSRMIGVMLGVLAGLVAMSAMAQTVVDGDTIKLNGTTYRIWGIDAAETKQACGWVAGRAGGDGRHVRAGQGARDYLR